MRLFDLWNRSVWQIFIIKNKADKMAVIILELLGLTFVNFWNFLTELMVAN